MSFGGCTPTGSSQGAKRSPELPAVAGEEVETQERIGEKKESRGEKEGRRGREGRSCASTEVFTSPHLWLCVKDVRRDLHNFLTRSHPASFLC